LKDDYQYGGQAVIEGVMMRGRDRMAIAVRRNPEEIVVHQESVGSIAKKYPVLKIPFIRGVVALCESFAMGLKSLLFSANQFIEEDQQQKLSPMETIFMVAIALLLTVVLFVLLPLGARSLMGNLTKATIWLNLGEGMIRALILVLYILLVSLLKDIRRVFAYHGAEHKTIHAYEAKEELTVQNVQKYTTMHPRCGTSFLLFVVVISALLFSILGRQTILMRIISRILLLPIVAGFSYELIKFAGRHSSIWIVRWISAPGLWLQRLTTRQPDDHMVVVAIAAMKCAINPHDDQADLIIKTSIESDLAVGS